MKKHWNRAVITTVCLAAAPRPSKGESINILMKFQYALLEGSFLAKRAFKIPLMKRKQI